MSDIPFTNVIDRCGLFEWALNPTLSDDNGFVTLKRARWEFECWIIQRAIIRGTNTSFRWRDKVKLDNGIVPT